MQAIKDAFYSANDQNAEDVISLTQKGYCRELFIALLKEKDDKTSTNALEDDLMALSKAIKGQGSIYQPNPISVLISILGLRTKTHLLSLFNELRKRCGVSAAALVENIAGSTNIYYLLEELGKRYLELKNLSKLNKG